MPFPLFIDPTNAGKELAKHLLPYKQQANTLILALLPSGLAVAIPIAKLLELPLDVYLVKKFSVPGQPKLVLGAIAVDDVVVFNDELLANHFVSTDEIGVLIESNLNRLAERNNLYRHNRSLPDIKDHTIILVDHGSETGSSLRAAIAALKKHQPQKIIVAIPVASKNALAKIKPEVDEVVYLHSPQPFYKIRTWYKNTLLQTEAELIELLESAQ